MKKALIVILLAVAIVGCAQVQPTPTPTIVPTAAPSATLPPTATPIPPTPTLAVTDTPVITNTPTATTTPTATVTNTRAPVTAKPKPTVTATNTTIALKYSAPESVEPKAGDTRIAGKDDLVFKWKPVADLGADECYEINVVIVNDVDQRWVPFSQIATDTCNSTLGGGSLKFSLNRPKFSPPTYGGLMDEAQKDTQSNTFTVKWSVMVVRNDGTPLSPKSAELAFVLQSP